MTKKQTKTDMIKTHLRVKGVITSWDAITLYRATRLSAVIYNLRDNGWKIRTDMQETSDGVRYANYVLED